MIEEESRKYESVLESNINVKTNNKKVLVKNEEARSNARFNLTIRPVTQFASRFAPYANCAPVSDCRLNVC